MILRARVASADAELHTLRHEVQAAHTELLGLRLRFPPRDHAKLLKPLVVLAVLVTILLYAGLLRGFGWI